MIDRRCDVASLFSSAIGANVLRITSLALELDLPMYSTVQRMMCSYTVGAKDERGKGVGVKGG